ncbi:IS3 family transposase [Flavobacterium sp. ANB]|uniref:IS3 family transposase n=1 Tax=Flavobacterium sp. ANB TaxID=2783790 RepID=UPI00188C64DC|nr:IS3 family transposase [Flavobacterium sp. ANB]MBF4519432.1 IS3 family transposase [Flavobacterium sp. ANB]
MAGKYKTYDRIFKENVVLLSYEKRTLKEFADELGIYPHYLTKWRKEYEKFGGGSFCGSGYERVHPDNKKFFELEKTSKESKLRFEILKNASPYLYQGNLIIYQFIKDNEKKYSIAQMCKVLGVGNGRYIRWKYNGVSEKRRQIALLKEDIKTIFFRFKKHYGRNKITQELHSLGYKISKEQVTFYMRQLGLRSVKKRKFIVTTDSNHNHYTAPNVLNREFKANDYSKVWVSDITYLQTTKGFLYLTMIMDLYDRKIVGWSLGSRLSTNKTTLPALEMALTNRKVLSGLIFHSDRGVQYANKAFTRKLDSYKCIRSMSRKGDHLDNAISESFFSSLKRELIDRKSNLLSKKQMKVEIFEFIENWYNKNRIHTALNYKTIEQFNSVNDCKKLNEYTVN